MISLKRNLVNKNETENDLKISWKLKKSLKDANDIINGKKKEKIYYNVDKMFEDILSNSK